MATSAETWILLDPTQGPTPKKLLRARLDTLDGKTVGVIWNGRPPGDLIFDEIFRVLRRRYDIKQVVIRRKPYLGNVAPEEILQELSTTCDAAITGVGD